MPSRRLHVSRLVYWVIVAGVFSVAAWRRFALPLDPIADLDTWGYLSPALLKLTGGEFVHVHGRNFVYPAFLLAVLRLFGDFRAIVIVQHFLGLAGGGLMLMAWQRVIHSLDGPRYSTIQFCFTVLAEFLALRLLVEAGLATFWNGHSDAKTPARHP